MTAGREQARPTPVILDVDPGHDDAVAIMLACGAPDLELLAVTTVAGNVPLEKTTRNALRILSLIGRPEVPVAAGASSPLDRPLHTAEEIHGESGLDGPEIPDSFFAPDERGGGGAYRRHPGEQPRSPVTLVPVGLRSRTSPSFSESTRSSRSAWRRSPSWEVASGSATLRPPRSSIST